MADITEAAEPSAAKPSAVAKRSWTTHLPPGLDELAEQKCKANGMTRSEFVRQLIAQSIAGAEPEPVRKRSPNRKPIVVGDFAGLVAMISEHPGGVTRRQLFRLTRTSPQRTIRHMLRMLVDRKAITEEILESGGRRGAIYRAADLLT